MRIRAGISTFRLGPCAHPAPLPFHPRRSAKPVLNHLINIAEFAEFESHLHFSCGRVLVGIVHDKGTLSSSDRELTRNRPPLLCPMYLRVVSIYSIKPSG